MREKSEWRWFARELKPFAKSQVFSIVAVSSATLLAAADPLIVKWIIDVGLRKQRWMPIVAAVLVFCTLYALRVYLQSAGTYGIALSARRAMLRLRTRILRGMNAADAAFYDRHTVGDLVTRLEQEIDQLGEIAADLLPSLLRILLAIVVIAGAMAMLDWRLALMTVPLTLLLGVLRAKYGPRLERASLTTRQAIADRSGFLTECVGAMTELQILGAGAYVRRRYGTFTIRSIRSSLAQIRTELTYSAMSAGIMILVSTVVLLVGAYEVLTGRMTIGTFVAFYSYMAWLFEPSSAAVAMYARVKRAGGSIARVEELDHRAHAAMREAESHEARPLDDIHEIDCREVTFRYREGEPILSGVTLNLRRGEKVALMGKSGSGKTTLARLLLRLYDHTEGSIRLDSNDIRDVSRQSLWNAISFVPSRPAVFYATLKENVLLGAPHVTDEELSALARLARFDSVVARFAEGWEHMLGASGSGLSDGEKQRLGLLRALVRNRRVLLLDEATGAIDALTENDILSALDGYAHDRIVLAITHRVSAAKWADRVVVLKDGEIHPIEMEST